MQGQDVQVSPGYTQDSGFLARMQRDFDGATPQLTQDGLGSNSGALVKSSPADSKPSEEAPKAARSFHGFTPAR